MTKTIQVLKPDKLLMMDRQENNFQGGVHIVPKDKVKEIADKMLGKTSLDCTLCFLVSLHL